jgi:crotonobetainyl-CoA:carnitine CoA-transferase CaiB-like acyl-CoA transferase
MTEPTSANQLASGPTGPLLGVRVLDISTVIAAPLAATLLADLGASVIKVELPGTGDPLRQLPPHKNGIPLWTKVTNRNKLGITIDLRKAKGIELIEKLVANQDVLIENFRPGVLAGWGLSKERLWQLNPRLVILRVTGFGQTGPYSSRPGFARIFEALSGFADLCGEPDGPPIFSGFPISDALAGVFGALSVAAALFERNKQGNQQGQEIDLSATESMFRILDVLPIEYDLLGVVRKRNGTRNAYSAPSDVYRTKDNVWISLAVSTPNLFERLARALARSDLLSDERFNTNVNRIANREDIESIVSDFIKERSFIALSAIFDKHQVSYSKIYNISDIFDDPHYADRDTIVDVPDPDFGTVKMQGVVPKFSRTPGCVWRSGPGIGEHSDEVLIRDLGLSLEEVEHLRLNGIV